jgi:hypothetical protein
MAHPTRLVHTEDDLLKVWNDYKDDLEERSKEWEKVQYVGKDGERVVDHMKVPLTFEGFKRYCWDNKIGCIEQYFTNQDNCYTDFIGVCSRIKTEIRENQIIGGLMGVWNPSITQRLNGLADKSEIDLKTEPRIFNID